METNKKSVIILLAVAVIIVVGIVFSNLINWSVDTQQTSGDIGKSRLYANKVSTGKLINMKELLLTDSAYKQDIVSAYTVMHTRAQQFNALVELSNEVAGEIEDFADLLMEMDKMRHMVTNACTQLDLASEDLGATLLGEERPDLDQNTINALLAYTTLQKQNYLADRFIETTDKYLKNEELRVKRKELKVEKLMLVRDSWMNYQQETAALENDTNAAKRLEEQGYLLSSKQTQKLLGSISPKNRELLGSRGLRNSVVNR